MLELHCQIINRKCVLDRHVSVKILVLNCSLDSTSLDTMHNVPDFIASQSFWTFFKINVNLQNLKIFGSAVNLLQQ